MSTEKVKAPKGGSMEETKDLHALVSNLLGEKGVRLFLESAKANADIMVERGKKDLKGEELEDFREECLRKAVFELLREFTVDAAQPRIMSKRWWLNASLQGVVNAAVLGGAVVAVGAITRARSTGVVEFPVDDLTKEPTGPFVASERPGRRGSRVEAVM